MARIVGDKSETHTWQWLNRAGEFCQGGEGEQEAAAGTGRRESASGGDTK